MIEILNNQENLLTICMRCLVSGKVQQVFYRASTRFEAEQREITGYAKNLSDGRVEVVACGERAKVDELMVWLHKGPTAANVTGVSSEPIPVQHFTEFTIG